MSNIQNVKDDIFKILFPYADVKRASDDEMITQILNLTYNGFTLRQAIETILTIKKDECLGVVKESAELPSKPDGWRKETMEFHAGYYHAEQDILIANFRQVTLMVYPSPLTKSKEGKNG